jgi:chromosome segregation protein
LVHINQVELTHFKSFGGSITIPLQEGFTVVTGPNGSGKSNILDAVLFCLGLASSRGMRADRLPDLINSAMLREGKAAETSVSVRFDLSEWQPDQAEAGLEPPEEGPWIKPGQQEWTVSRRLRVAPGGTYASSFSADGVSCNLQQLQSQLRRLRVDPEGSNVVMQGDVTRIVSMSARDRRGIIDELAGVALFDSRIEQSRGKLDEVQERQERCSIVQQQLLSSRQKLERDCAKARTYQDLRQRHHNGRMQEQVLAFEAAQANQAALRQRSASLASQQQAERKAISEGETGLAAAATVLEQLQAEVKALGEDQLIAVQAELAGLEASGRELTRQAGKHQLDAEALQRQRHELARTQGELRQQQQALEASSDQAALNDADAGCRDAEAACGAPARRDRPTVSARRARARRGRHAHRKQDCDAASAAPDCTRGHGRPKSTALRRRLLHARWLQHACLPVQCGRLPHSHQGAKGWTRDLRRGGAGGRGGPRSEDKWNATQLRTRIRSDGPPTAWRCARGSRGG